MHDANEMECLIFENAIKNILLGKVTKSGVSDANNKLIITIFQMWGHIDPIRSGIGLTSVMSKIIGVSSGFRYQSRVKYFTVIAI